MQNYSHPKKPKGQKNQVDYSTLPPRVFDDRQNKEVWANYVNMARQNLFMALMHITKVLGLPVSEKNDYEGNLMSIPAVTELNKKGKPELKEKAMRMYDRHFPFLMPMMEKLIERSIPRDKKGDPSCSTAEIQALKQKTPATYYKVMELILPLMNLLRNKYTHYRLNDERLNSEEQIIDKKLLAKNRVLASLIGYCFDGARRVVKERFGTGEKCTLKDSDFDFLTGEPRYYKEDNKFKERPDFKYRVYDGERGLSNIGFFMLICLFLEKRYASEFADQTDFFRTNSLKPASREMMSKEVFIMREVISIYRIRLPKERMQSTRADSALALDMLNELKKCPGELFETLSPADQEKFRVEVDADEAQDSEGCGLEDKVLLRRSFDRFSTLALQYIDTNRLFDDIRFQVELGNYRFKFYGKTWIDQLEDDERIRILQKELTGYGRLQEIEQERNRRWAGVIRKIDKPRQDTLETEPYVTDHHASYLFTNNRIGLLWNTPESQPMKHGIFMPSLDLPEWLKDYPGNADKIRGTEEKLSQKIAENLPPVCWLSVFDLPAVIFLSLLTGSGKRAEEIIKKTVAEYRRLFADIASGKVTSMDDLKDYSIGPKDIPYKIQQYLKKEKVKIGRQFNIWAEATLDDMLRRTERRLEVFREELKTYGSKENKVGKKSHVDIRPGFLARFLAEDMMRFKPSDKDNPTRMTGQNFNILQAALAQFANPGDWLRVKHILEAGELTTGERKHPFLGNALKKTPGSFFQLYEQYLEAKKAYLQNIKEDQNCWKELHFLYPERTKWKPRVPDFYRELATKYTSIELPHHIFMDAIMEELAKQKEYASMTIAERENVADLIQKYFKALGDGSQPFYGNAFKRYYKYMSMTQKPAWDEADPHVPLVKKYYSVAEMENFRKQLMEKYPDAGQRLDFLKERYYEALRKRMDIQVRKLEESLKKQVAKRRIDQYQADDRLRRGKNRLKNELNEELEKLRAKDKDGYDKLDYLHAQYTKSEKTIRRYKVQDMLLFLMAKAMLKSLYGERADYSAYKLCHIGGNAENDILSQQLPFSIVIDVPTGDAEHPVRSITISQEDLKLKNFGDFFRFIYDRRIGSLLRHARGDSFTRKTLEEELDQYNQVRIPTFKVIHQVEGKLWELLPVEKLHPKDESVKVDFKYLLQFVDIKEENKELVKAIRNAFCHNNYPTTPIVVRTVFDKVDVPKVAEQLSRELQNKTSQIRLKRDADNA